jgi:hypothetical protein
VHTWTLWTASLGFELRCCCYCLLEPAEHFPASRGSVCWEKHPICSDRLIDWSRKVGFGVRMREKELLGRRDQQHSGRIRVCEMDGAWVVEVVR